MQIPRCQPTIELVRAGFPFHDTCSRSDQRVLWCRYPVVSRQLRPAWVSCIFHFTIPVAVRACWGLAQITPVVSRQLRPAWVSIPFHDTCSSSGQRMLWCRYPVVSRQSSLLGRNFHFTIPVVVRASGCSGADRLVVSRQSNLARVIIPFHDTCSRFGLLGSDVDNPCCQPTIAACQGQISISRYL